MYQLTSYGETYKIDLVKKEYTDGGLAIRLDYFDEEMQGWLPYAFLTVNLGRQNYGYAYVDINNCPWAEDFIEENGLGEFTGKVYSSGFCFYPLYKFNMDKI